MYMIIPYCKGALFDIINVATLVVYATIETKFQCAKNLPKTPRQKPAKNPLKIRQPKIQQKSFMITLTKNLLKILNNNKKPLISSNKTKTFIMKQLFKTDYVIYNKENDKPIFWSDGIEIVIFGDKSEAIEDARGNEIVISCTELPKHWQNILLQQINNN